MPEVVAPEEEIGDWNQGAARIQVQKPWSAGIFCVWWWQLKHFWNFHPSLGKISNLTNISQMGWFSHQLVWMDRLFWVPPPRNFHIEPENI